MSSISLWPVSKATTGITSAFTALRAEASAPLTSVYCTYSYVLWFWPTGNRSLDVTTR